MDRADPSFIETIVKLERRRAVGSGGRPSSLEIGGQPFRQLGGIQPGLKEAATSAKAYGANHYSQRRL
jgi:hypothetical protein